MPARDRSRPPQRAPRRAAAARGSTNESAAAAPRDLSAIPAFLREPGGRHEAASGADAPPRPATPSDPAAPDPEPDPSPLGARLDPATLPMPSLSRRRVVTAAGVLLAALMTLTFLRQVGEATAATNRADELRAANAALRDEVARLEHDLGHVQDPRYIQLEGRAFGLGAKRELPFALAAGAPSLPPDAPGSAAVRLGAEPPTTSPLDTWLEALFGAGR